MQDWKHKYDGAERTVHLQACTSLHVTSASENIAHTHATTVHSLHWLTLLDAQAACLCLSVARETGQRPLAYRPCDEAHRTGSRLGPTGVQGVPT